MPSKNKDKLLEVAQTLVQEKGYQGFSFHDLSAAVGITTASIHYHFPTKAHLGIALIQSYRACFENLIAEVKANHDSPKAQFEALLDIFDGTLGCSKICICGAMSGEFHGLPEDVREELKTFIIASAQGIQDIIEAAQQAGEISADYDAKTLAELWNNTLQGTMAIGRATQACKLGAPIDLLKEWTFSPAPAASPISH
ncbi:MAG: TetR/AcrR family transcriptional regulator [Opitutales bacterium]